VVDPVFMTALKASMRLRFMAASITHLHRHGTIMQLNQADAGFNRGSGRRGHA
jgi:hypothetical protein